MRGRKSLDSSSWSKISNRQKKRGTLRGEGELKAGGSEMRGLMSFTAPFDVALFYRVARDRAWKTGEFHAAPANDFHLFLRRKESGNAVLPGQDILSVKSCKRSLEKVLPLKGPRYLRLNNSGA